KRKYARLLEQWVGGMPFDFNRLWADGRPQRLSLPTYPFARDRYWPEAAPAGAFAVVDRGGIAAAFESGALQIRIDEDDDGIAWEIYSDDAVHAQGRTTLDEAAPQQKEQEP